MKKSPPRTQECPCQSGKLYQACCQPVHESGSPQNPLQLMRARYSAYALNIPGFIIETTSPENSGYQHDTVQWRRQLRRYCKETTYTGLKILSIEPGSGSAEGFVTFEVSLSQQGRSQSFAERSRFVKVNGRWLYHSRTLQ